LALSAVDSIQTLRSWAAIPINPTENGKAAFNQFFGSEKKEEDPFEII
jgi:hypothetical protein